jgi:uncharacterized membrane protein YeaQ/YmgE (transglycosylase-associated protein family)
MGFIAWLVSGGIMGCLANLVLKRDASQDLLLDIVVGIVGAIIAGWAFAPFEGTGTLNDSITLAGIGISMAGAAVLLAIIHFFTRIRAK